METSRSGSGHGEENVGIPDDLRCKRSDGKQWRCTAMSMPDKTVCEKHYIQAKRRAANSALRANLKKGQRKSVDDSELYSESKSDDLDVPLGNAKAVDYNPAGSGKKYLEKVKKDHFRYSLERPPLRSMAACNSLRSNDGSQEDLVHYEENWRAHRSPPPSAMEPGRNRSLHGFDSSAMTEYSDGTSESSEDTGGQTCHQCRRNDRSRVVWCLKCDRRGYCDSCISTWYSDIPMDEIEKVCPACRGSCNCKLCLRADNLVKVRIRKIPVLEKLQYLYSLLSSVLPVVKQIHQEQCFEVELEKRLRGTDIDLARTKLNADEQMCCNICRVPIIDYHRHCASCSYDLCLSCCQDLRGAAEVGFNGKVIENQTDGQNPRENTTLEQVKASRPRLNLSEKYSGWTANSNGSIPCPPKEYGGCGYPSLNLCRIFKMNWVAKLVKNVEEMVGGCKINDAGSLQNTGLTYPRLCQFAHREGSDDNFLYCPSAEDIRMEGIRDFRKNWARGQPVIVKEVCDNSSLSSWDPKFIWRGIRETADEKMKDENRLVKAIDFFDGSEVDIEIGEFIKGYFEGRSRDNGEPQMLKLKDWPSPSASEEFLLYNRPEFISRLPLLEYIHSKLGFLNVAAKLPHYSLQNDVGPKIFMSYGTYEELGRGDSVSNLHSNMRDMVYLMVHSCDVNSKGYQKMDIEKTQNSFLDEVGESSRDHKTSLNQGLLPHLALGGQDMQNESETIADGNDDAEMEDQRIENRFSFEDKSVNGEQSSQDNGNFCAKAHPAAQWDVFRRQDVSKLGEYLRLNWSSFGKPHNLIDDSALLSLYGETIFLNEYHKSQLKEQFGIEPWSFEQHIWEAVFVPAGCPFQVRNLQSTVQLGLDFLFPESMGEASRLAEETCGLPNDHEAKLQILEVGKISLYAASSGIKEVQKLVLDPKFGAELGFGDPNLTAPVSENLKKLTKGAQIPCA